MKATIDEAVDGRRLIRVNFQRQSPDAKTPFVEVVYRLYWPEDFTIKGNPFVLMPLSCTRTDTREEVTLLPEEITLTMEAAVNRAATVIQEW